jgi:hypothetical protein
MCSRVPVLKNRTRIKKKDGLPPRRERPESLPWLLLAKIQKWRYVQGNPWLMKKADDKAARKAAGKKNLAE